MRTTTLGSKEEDVLLDVCHVFVIAPSCCGQHWLATLLLIDAAMSMQDKPAHQMTQPSRRFIMNTSKFAIAAVLAAASFSSMAATVDMPSVTISATMPSTASGDSYTGYTGFVSSKSRAEVLQELRDAQRRGEIYTGDAYPGPLVAQSVKTRAEVISELKTYRLTHTAVSDDGAIKF